MCVSVFLVRVSCVCSYSLSLKVLVVSPLYVSDLLLSYLLTVAWYTTPYVFINILSQAKTSMKLHDCEAIEFEI